MKIYFAGSIRGGREDVQLYTQLIDHLKQYGEVLTEHVGDGQLDAIGEEEGDDRYIHDRDMQWLLSSDIIVAEVTQPSLGVGYEIGRAIELGKQVFCLYRPQEEKQLSAMIAGSPSLEVYNYTNLDKAKSLIDELFSDFT